MTVSADQIERFLRDNPSGPLWVTVGFASAFGLAWLNERTRGRPVRLLIGDTRTGFANSSEDDRRAAIRFSYHRTVSSFRRHTDRCTRQGSTVAAHRCSRPGSASIRSRAKGVTLSWGVVRLSAKPIPRQGRVL